MKAVIFLCSFLVSTFGMAEPQSTFSVTVNIKNFVEAQGHLRLALVTDKNDFPNAKQPAYSTELRSERTMINYTFMNVKPGTYAVTVYQDTNDNNKLDKSFFGIPKEPYGFSRNPKIGLSPPKFEETEIVIYKDVTIEIELNH